MALSPEKAKEMLNALLSPALKAMEDRVSAASSVKSILAGLDADRLAANAPKKGEAVGRMVRALAHAKGDTRRAAEYALNTLHDEVTAKALGTSTGDAGGFMVPIEQSTELIELLRPRSVVRSLGPLTIPMDSGVMSIPRLAGGATAQYQSENTATNASQETLEQLNLTWKKLTAIVPVSNELLRMSNPSADAMVRDDLVLSMATAEDSAFIRADGTVNQIRGLKYWCTSGSTTASAGTSLANVDTDVKFLINSLTNNNVRMIRPGFIMSPRSKTMFEFLRTVNGPLAYPTMVGPNPILMGYPVGVSNNVPNNTGNGSQSEVYLADFADVVIGEATQIILEVSSEAAYLDNSGTMRSSFASDQTIVKAIARHDMAMRHTLSIAYLSAVAWA